MGLILNDNKAKYFDPKKSIIDVLIKNSPITDSIFNEIVEAYDADEEDVMDQMIKCDKGEFARLSDGWEFISIED